MPGPFPAGFEKGELGGAITKFKAGLWWREKAAREHYFNAFKAAWNESQRELQQLYDKWDAAAQRGERISPAWLYQEARLFETQKAIIESFNHVQPRFSEEMQAEYVKLQETLAINQENMVRAQIPPGQGASVQWTAPDTAAATEAAGAFYEGSPLRTLFEDVGAGIAQEAQDVLVTGSLLGRGVNEIARELRRKAGIGLTRGLLIARTETNRFARQATRELYSKNRDILDGWTWHADLSTETCPACWRLHGEVFPITEVLSDHPNGRCGMVPLTKSWADLGVDGVEETHVEISSAEDAFRNLPDEKQISIMGKAKWLAYMGGDVRWTDLAVVKDHPLWGSSVREASLDHILGPEKSAWWKRARDGQEKLPYSMRELFTKKRRRALNKLYYGRLRFETEPPPQEEETRLRARPVPKEQPPGGWTSTKDDLLNTVKGTPSYKEAIGQGVFGAERWEWDEDDLVLVVKSNPVERARNSQAEIISYEIDQALGLNMVPPTVTWESEGRQYSGQLFVKGQVLMNMETQDHLTEFLEKTDAFNRSFLGGEDLPNIPDSLKDDRIKLGVFDFLTGNMDRHAGNVLYSEGRLYAIDNGLASFIPKEYKAPDVLVEEFTKAIQRNPELAKQFLQFASADHWRELLSKGVSTYGEFVPKRSVDALSEVLSSRMSNLLDRSGALGLLQRSDEVDDDEIPEVLELLKEPWEEFNSVKKARRWLVDRGVKVQMPKEDERNRQLNWLRAMSVAVDEMEARGFNLSEVGVSFTADEWRAHGEALAWYNGVVKKPKIVVNTSVSPQHDQYINWSGRPEIRTSNLTPGEWHWHPVTDRNGVTTMIHEWGHALHGKNVGQRKYNLFREWPSKETEKAKEKALAGEISRYATANPYEFVAETFSFLMAGGRPRDEIMELYAKYGGPEPPEGWFTS